MKEIRFLVSICLTLALTVVTVFAAAPGVLMNGTKVDMNHPAVVCDGKVFLPADDIFYAMGQRIRYDSRAGTATVTKDGEYSVCYTENSTTVADGGCGKVMNAEACRINGVFYIPMESVPMVYGGSARWNEQANVVEIEQKGFRFGLDSIRLYRPEEVVPVEGGNGVHTEILEEYAVDIPIDPGVTEYTQVVSKDRIPIVQVMKTYYGIDYKITQAYKKRPTATVTLRKDGEEYIYTIRFIEAEE